MAEGLRQGRAMVKFLWVGIVAALVSRVWADGFVENSINEAVPPLWEETYGSSKAASEILMVGLTLVEGAAAKGAGISYIDVL